jgi:hypothetical protein
MILKIMNVFDIDELVKHIYSFIPQKSIGPCMLVNRRFYKMIDIDDNYESVAKNEDFFSLGKIKYSPYAVMHIAKDNGNTDMMRYLLKRGYDEDDYLMMAGFIGDVKMVESIKNEKMVETMILNMYRQNMKISEFVVGVCDGMHIDLLGKYKECIWNRKHLEIIVFNAHKNGNESMCNELKDIIDNYDKMYGWGQFHNIKLSAIIAREQTDVDSIKFKILDSIISNVDSYIFFDSLVLGNHYDVFEWIVNHEKVKHNGYNCFNYDILEYLIKKDNYKFFSTIFLNHFRNYRFQIYGKTIISGYDLPNFIMLIEWCIKYKRICMLELVLSCVQFEITVYHQLFKCANDLGFFDVGEIISEKIDI